MLLTVDVSLKVQPAMILELLQPQHVLAFVWSYKLTSIDSGCSEDEYTTDFMADVPVCYPIRIKGKIVSVCAMNVYGEVEVLSPVILQFSTIGVCGQLRDPAVYIRGKSSLAPLKRRLGGPQILLGRVGADTQSRNRVEPNKIFGHSHKASTIMTSVFMRKFVCLDYTKIIFTIRSYFNH
jgi:hypothetical protein